MKTVWVGYWVIVSSQTLSLNYLLLKTALSVGGNMAWIAMGTDCQSSELHALLASINQKLFNHPNCNF
jgi:hypothetical protein